MASTWRSFFSSTWYCIAKPLSGSTAPSLGLRSRTCPYDARTSKSLPRYFLIVFALAGDSTMTRLSAITYANSRRSVRRVGVNIGYQIFQSLERLFLSGLARQHHEHHPVQLLRVQFVGIERQHPVDHDLALLRGEYSEPLQRDQKSAALGGQPGELAVRVNTQGTRRQWPDGQRRPVPLLGEIGVPIKRTLDIRVSEAHTFQVARQMLSFGHLGYLIEHVAVEYVNQDVENGAGHHQGMRPKRPPG